MPAIPAIPTTTQNNGFKSYAINAPSKTTIGIKTITIKSVVIKISENFLPIFFHVV